MSATSAPDPGREERAVLVAFASLAGIGPATLLALHREGAPRAWEALLSGRGRRVAALAEESERRKDRGWIAQLARVAAPVEPDAVLARHEADGQVVLALEDPGYPRRLRADQAPPAVVFVRGDLARLDGPSVAIVGTRNATQLGRVTAAALAVELAERGISVVSGLALGIDAAAHEPLVARTTGGGPIGVVATGLERAYPRRHELLHRQVASRGVLLSESPIGSEPSRWRFPARNRIIATLAHAVVVVESRSTGGSMLTASEAVARDRPVLAVPGHPTAAAAAGTLDLICDGAMPLRDVADVLVAMGMGGRAPTDAAPPELPTPVGERAARLLEELDANPKTLSELVLAGAGDLEKASAALTELEQAGLIVRSGAWFERAGSSIGRPGTRQGQ